MARPTGKSEAGRTVSGSDAFFSFRQGGPFLLFVIPAKAGIQGCKSSLVALDPGFRRGDGWGAAATRRICSRLTTYFRSRSGAIAAFVAPSAATSPGSSPVWISDAKLRPRDSLIMMP